MIFFYWVFWVRDFRGYYRCFVWIFLFARCFGIGCYGFIIVFFLENWILLFCLGVNVFIGDGMAVRLWLMIRVYLDVILFLGEINFGV